MAERIGDRRIPDIEATGSAAGVRLPRQFGELRWTARAKETSASVFLMGAYPPPIQALLEFTDNAFGHRNRDQVHATVINVALEPDRDRLSITDFGGLGADADNIRAFARVGDTTSMGIGYRGAGAKYAAWFFGEDLEIRTKRAKEDIEYSTTIVGFGDPTIEYAGPFAIDAHRSEFAFEKGRFEIIVRRLKDPRSLPMGAALRRALAEVYRPLVTTKPVNYWAIGQLETRKRINSSGEIEEVNDKVVLRVNAHKKTEQVMPLPIPLVPGYSEDCLQMTETEEGEKLGYWLGETDLTNSQSKNVKPGIRFYYDGRLLFVDYCGFDAHDPRLAGLVGEVHLDNVVDIKSQLSVNKSAGLNLQSDQWRRVLASIHKAAKPLVEEILKRPAPVLETKPAFLDRAFSSARKITDLCIREMALDEIMITPEDLVVMVGETKGQRANPPQADRPPAKKTKPGTPWKDQEGQTIPAPDADEKIKRIRKSFIDGVELRGFDNPQPVSALREISTVDSGTRRFLSINATNPLVGITFLEGELAVMRLVNEELTDHFARQFSSNTSDYLKMRAELRFRSGLLLQNTPAYRALLANQQTPTS